MLGSGLIYMSIKFFNQILTKYSQNMAPVTILRSILQLYKRDLIRHVSNQSNASKTNVGFIGVGNMGHHMVDNLMKNGHNVKVYDISKQACEAVRHKGAEVCQSPKEATENVNFVITMLPNNDIVFNTYEDIVKHGTNSKTFYIDSSTIDPNVAKSVQKLIKINGGNFVDAPVSGGVPGAEAGTLTFMVGGTEDEYNTVKPVLQSMGKNITHCGTYGMGQAAKLCNNMLLGISMIGVCEAMNLAIRLGLDAKTFSNIVNSSTGRCWSSEAYNPVPGIVPTAPCNKNYDGGFSTELITKDLGLASIAAISSDTPIPLGSMAHQVYRTIKTLGKGDRDFSVVYDYLKNKTEH